jgi:signal transduction histidine kinase
MELPEAARSDVDVVRRNAQLLLGQVEDLLDLARLEAGHAKLRLARVDLAELVRATAASFDALAADRQTTVVVETPAALEAVVDEDRARRIVLNLLSNALKFTPPGGRVRLAAIPRGGDVEILVEDSGPGIPEDLREAVFERFRQLGDGERGGTGIGLAITREFARMHGGDVTAGASPDGGASFRVRLPLRRGEVAPEAVPAAFDGALARATAGLAPDTPAPEPALPADPRHPVALVVEDHPDMRRFVSRVLEEASYRVFTARDGVEGAARAKELVPDVIVSDLAMPAATGEALVAAVRADPVLDHTPIVLLTARADEALRVHLLSHGAQDWIQKPFVAEELRVRVDNLVQVGRLRRFLQQQLESRATDVDVLVRELDATRKLAERSSQVKSTFLRAVSHELRAPLHALGLALDLVVRRPQERDLVLQQAHQSLARMRSLVEALLERARLEGATMRLSLTTFALGDVVRGVVEAHRARAAQKGLALVIDGEAAITSDRQLVHVVIDNLVRNAVEVTPAGRVEGTIEPGARVVVRDAGPGLAGVDVERMFEPFGQARELGIGLSLVRDLCEALGGEVTGRSEATGAVFTVALPSLANDRVH